MKRPIMDERIEPSTIDQRLAVEAPTPIIDALTAHVRHEKVSLHVPGHHRGRMMPHTISSWLGRVTELDATELDGLDNLHQPSDCILASEERTAAYYGASRSLYSVNGSTACVMAAIRACVSNQRDQVVVIGPSHVSLWRGLVYADAVLQFVPSEYHLAQQTFVAASAEGLSAALEMTKNVACVFVTSPTYEGVVSNVTKLADIAHQHQVPLVVDEAHGAHFGLHTAFPQHSVAAGADIVIQSPHKTLPCLTQAAWMHVREGLVRSADVEEALNFLQTTSPSYVLLASLDAVQAWLWQDGQRIAEQTVAQLNALRPAPEPDTDPLRLWIPASSNDAISRLDASLKNAGVCLEYVDARGALAMFGLGQPLHEFERFFRVYDDWLYVETQRPSELARRNEDLAFLYTGAPPAVTSLRPREVSYCRGAWVSLDEAIGQPLKRPLCPYPPGIPVLWPGQAMESTHVDIFRRYLAAGGTILGVDENEQVEVCL